MLLIAQKKKNGKDDNGYKLICDGVTLCDVKGIRNLLEIVSMIGAAYASCCKAGITLEITTV